ncbi:MAG: MarR family winged helix-turn-helix transcriptional regulator [Acidimicrobiales bacterium]
MPATDDVRIDDALAALFRLAGDARLHERRLAQTGVAISATGHRLLDQLTEHGTGSVSQLARALHLTLPTASRQLQQLERLGFVARGPDAADGRVVTYAITPAGRGAQRRFRAVIRREVRHALSGWDAADRSQLAGLLERMVDDFRRPTHGGQLTDRGSR